MKQQTFKFLAGLTVLLLFLSVQAFAQDGGSKPTTISAADQKAITALFAGVDKKKYRLQFDDGKRVIGTKQISMAQLKQVRKIVNPVEAAGYIVLIVEGNNVVYVLAIGKKSLTTALGDERVAKLNTIMAKYAK